MLVKIWIETTECMGAGTCEQIAPAAFAATPDGVWTVKEDATYFGTTKVMSSREAARVPDAIADDVLDAIEQCPAECIFVEP
jgi:ferredoxin